MHIIVLAGGKGSRLWPLSNQSFPKQFLTFGQETSFLQKTVGRFSPRHPVFVSTNQAYEMVVKNQVQKFQGVEVITEPEGRNTAPAIAWNLKILIETKRLSFQDICLISPSDLYFSDEDYFLSLLALAEKEAKRGKIITFGITPTRADTAYGYLRVLKKKGPFFSVETFVEKPDLKKTKRFLKEGRSFWNAGIFVFQVRHFLDELKHHIPEIDFWMKLSLEKAKKCFFSLPSISIDHALMEKTSHLLLIPYTSGWSDLGSWERLYEHLSKDENRNVKLGQVLAQGCKNSFFYSMKRPLLALGIENLFLIETPEVILAIRKELLQHMGKLLVDLKNFKKKKAGGQQILAVHQNYFIELLTLMEQQSVEIKALSRASHWVVLNGVARVVGLTTKEYREEESFDLKQEKAVILNLKDNPLILVRIEMKALLQAKR